MRVRKVYPTDEVPHKWAHQALAEARNPQGNLFFEGATLYSYRTSYPIARICKRGKETLVLIRSDRYSVTTARHLDLAARATSHLDCITVPDVMPYNDEAHRANIAYLIEQHAKALAKAKRALSTWPARYAYDSGKQALKDARAYRDYFKIKGAKIPRFPADEWAAALARVQRIENPDPASHDKRERASARRQAAARAVLAAKFQSWRERIEAHNAAVVAAQTMTAEDVAAHWREHGAWPQGVVRAASWSLFCPRKDTRKFRDAGLGDLPNVARGDAPMPNHVLLRVDGDQIHTSLGARVPVGVAAMVWARVERCRLNGQAYERRSDALGGVKIGDYPLDSIGADGTLHAGCHVIPHHELARMARALNLIQEQAAV